MTRGALAAVVLAVASPLVAAGGVEWQEAEPGVLAVAVDLADLDRSDPDQVARRFVEEFLLGLVQEYQRRMPVAMAEGMGLWVSPLLTGELAEQVGEVFGVRSDRPGEAVLEIIGSEDDADGRRQVAIEVRRVVSGGPDGEGVPTVQVYRVDLGRAADGWRIAGLALPCALCRGDGLCPHPEIEPPAPESDCQRCAGRGACPACEGAGYRPVGPIAFPLVEAAPAALPGVDRSSAEAFAASYWRVARRVRATVEGRILAGLAGPYRAAMVAFLDRDLLDAELTAGLEAGRAVLDRSRRSPSALAIGPRRLRPGGRVELPGFIGREASRRTPPDLLFVLGRTGDGWSLVALRTRCTRCAGRGQCELCEGTGRRLSGDPCSRCQAAGRCVDCEGEGYRDDLLL